MLERRLAMSERANPTDDPGLVLGDDGVVYEVASDGTRTAIGGGGSLPSQWTAGASGTLDMAPDDPTVDHLFRITAPAGFADDSLGDGALFELASPDGDMLMEIDADGTFTFKAPTDQGNPAFRLQSVDNPNDSLQMSTTRLKLGDGINTHYVALDSAAAGAAPMLLISDVGAGPGGSYDPSLFLVMVEAGGADYLFSVGNRGGITVWDGLGADPLNQTWWVTDGGYEVSRTRGEPADGDIRAGEVFSYFDATNGAAKFWRKGKTLDGTVVKTSANMT